MVLCLSRKPPGVVPTPKRRCLLPVNLPFFRAEAQVLRLSAIYAALDSSPLIDACHLQAAFAVWDYCCASARLLFDTAPIDPTARRISQALDVTPEGLSRVQIRALFNRHVSKERIDLALEQLMTLGLINRETSAGRDGLQPYGPNSKPRKPSAWPLMAHRALKAHTFPEAYGA
jgi:hypothetical protein